eukprot:470943-Pelagomonas_calceolata.AAC.6
MQKDRHVEVLGVAQRLFCTHFGRRDGFSNSHQMTSAPGLQLLSSRLVMLHCQVLRWGTGGAC